MCRRSGAQKDGSRSRSSVQLIAHTMSSSVRSRAVAAAVSSSPRRRITRDSGRPSEGSAPASRTGGHALLSAAQHDLHERVDDALDLRPRAEHVVAAAVERQVRGLQRKGSFQLFVDDRPGEPASDGEDRGTRWGSPSSAAQPCAVRSAHPRGVPSGRSSPTPSVKLSPMAANRTFVTSPSYERGGCAGAVRTRFRTG